MTEKKRWYFRFIELEVCVIILIVNTSNKLIHFVFVHSVIVIFVVVDTHTAIEFGKTNDKTLCISHQMWCWFSKSKKKIYTSHIGDWWLVMVLNFENILFLLPQVFTTNILSPSPPPNCAIDWTEHMIFRFQIKKKNFHSGTPKKQQQQKQKIRRINQMCID